MSAELPAAGAAARRSPRWWLITPLIFTTLPLLRHVLRGAPPARRHAAYAVAVAAGLLHGFSTMFAASDAPQEGLPGAEEATYSPAQLARRGGDR